MNQAEPSPGEQGWGPVAAGLLGAGVLLVSSVVASTAALPILHWKKSAGFPRTDLTPYDGDANGVGLLIAAPLAILVVLWLQRLRGVSLRDVFGGVRVAPLALVGWILALVGINAGGEALGRWLGAPEIPESMLIMYQSAVLRIPLIVALVIVGPLFEEVVFRGFLLPAWANSRVGPWGAVVLSSIAWAAIHVQYFDQPLWMALIVVLGILFGAARLVTRGLLLPLLLHALNNAAAVLQMASAVSGMSE